MYKEGGVEKSSQTQSGRDPEAELFVADLKEMSENLISVIDAPPAIRSILVPLLEDGFDVVAEKLLNLDLEHDTEAELLEEKRTELIDMLGRVDALLTRRRMLLEELAALKQELPKSGDSTPIPEDIQKAIDEREQEVDEIPEAIKTIIYPALDNVVLEKFTQSSKPKAA